MTFTITYRGKDGALHEEPVEAVNRAECLAACKRKGIAPTKIREGRTSARARAANTVAAHAAGAKRKIGISWKAAIMTATCLAVGLGAWWWLGREAPRPAPIEKPAKPKVAKPQPAPKPVAKPSEKVVAPPKPERKLTPDEKRAARSAEIRANMKPLVRKDIVERPDGSFLYTDSKGRRICCLEKHEVVDERNKFRSPFKHRVEAYLSNFAVPGQSVPPMPPMNFSLEDIQASLAEPIEVNMNTDDEDLIAKKQNVEQLKGFLKEAIDQGMSFPEFMQRLQERQRSEASLVQESRKMIIETLNAGKAEEARELLDALNKNLNDNGIPNLRLPGKYRKMMEREQQ